MQNPRQKRRLRLLRRRLNLPRPRSPQRRPSAPPPVQIDAPGTKIPLTTIKRVTARRLTESKQNVPHFYVTIDVELDALLKLRGELNARSPKEGAGVFKLSVNDMLIKACAVTLRQVPNVNASFLEDGIFLYDDVDISVAVSIPGGLITPIIRKADQKGLSAISNEGKVLFDKAKNGKLKPEEYMGGRFLDLQYGHVWRARFRRHHQSAAGGHSRGRRRRAEGHRAKWRIGRGPP